MKWQRVVGESISLRGLKSLIPGNWIKDEIVNCSIKRHLDETQAPENIKIMDTHFYSLIAWDDKRRKIVDYKSGRRWFKNTDIFKLEHLIIPINTEDHWFVIFVVHPDKIVDWGRYADTNF